MSPSDPREPSTAPASSQAPRPARVPICCDADALVASQKGRTLAARLGFSTQDQTAIAIAIAEVARNIAKYAGRGEIVIRPTEPDQPRGIVIVAHDKGPGISDVEQAMQDGYSTGDGLGLGLPGARRLMDTFDIISEVGKGTTVTMRKWSVYEQ